MNAIIRCLAYARCLRIHGISVMRMGNPISVHRLLIPNYLKKYNAFSHSALSAYIPARQDGYIFLSGWLIVQNAAIVYADIQPAENTSTIAVLNIMLENTVFITQIQMKR